MSKKKKPFKVPTRRQPVWKPISCFLKLFFKKPKIVNLNQQLPQSAILVGNHSAMDGPMGYELHLPIFHAAWGAHPMLGNYKMRFHYLRDVYFVQKRGMGKAKASFIAFFEAVFSIFLYKGMKVLPTYHDGRLASTIRNSVKCLRNGVSVLIFPENSDDGYHEILTEFLPGFVSLAEWHKKLTGEDVPIVPLYYSKKHKTMVIGKASTLADYPNMGRTAVAEEFRKQVNALFTDVVCKQD